MNCEDCAKYKTCKWAKMRYEATCPLFVLKKECKCK